MHADREPESTPAESEEYVTPELTDLGSFEELTKFTQSGPAADGEGFSAGPE